MIYNLKEIKKIIKEDKEKKEGKYYARIYYNYKPNKMFPDMSTSYEKDIANDAGEEVTITKERQPWINTNYTKLLVNQKVDYMLANEPTIEEIPKQYSLVKIADTLENMALTASLDIEAWLFFYVKDNLLNWVLIPDCQIKPVYDEFGEEIIEIIRYYEIKNSTYVEIWSLGGVQTLNYKSENNIDAILKEDFTSHYNIEIWYNGELTNKEAKNLPFVPFIKMCNNKNLENDIDCIKDQLDFYNIIKSGFVGNVFKFQEMLMKLQGFTGDDEFYDETMKKMQKFKMICLPDNETDADYISVDIPVEAREILLTSIKENIFKIGQGLDPDKIGDGNITNIVIKNRYSALDMKANKTIKQSKVFYEKFIDCINMFYKTSYKSDITFNKSVIWNESEIIDNLVKSMDMIPDEIILETHPYIKDLEKAKKLMEEQKQKRIEEFNNNMSNFNDDNE